MVSICVIFWQLPYSRCGMTHTHNSIKCGISKVHLQKVWQTKKCFFCWYDILNMFVFGVIFKILIDTRCDILNVTYIQMWYKKVTMIYLDIKISHLQTADFIISHLVYLNFQNTTPYIFSTFIMSHQLINDCQNTTPNAKYLF